jgi:hypothetical protein
MEKPAGKRERDEAHAAEGSLRQCILTREERPVGELIRFVVSPDGWVTPDVARKLPGRGVWVTATEEAVRTAIERKAFQRALKTEVRVDPNLPGMVGDLLLKRVLGLLSMANKAGLVVTGFTKCERALERGEAFALLHALEAGKDGVGKLDRRLAILLDADGIKGKALERRVIRFLTNAELSLAIGRPNVVHAALRAGGAGKALLAEAERLLRYRLGASFEAAA